MNRHSPIDIWKFKSEKHILTNKKTITPYTNLTLAIIGEFTFDNVINKRPFSKSTTIQRKKIAKNRKTISCILINRIIQETAQFSIDIIITSYTHMRWKRNSIIDILLQGRL